MSRITADLAAEELLAALTEKADPARADAEARYLKSARVHLGVPVPVIRRLAVAAARRYPVVGAADARDLATAVWDQDFHESRMAAVEVLVAHADLLGPDDLDYIECLLRDSGTWALVDNLAERVAGSIVAAHPPSAATLDRWAADGDFWIRRSAVLALLGPIRSGGGDVDRFFRYADAMVGEREFFIRKAVGWVLRELSKTRPHLVAAWLADHDGEVSGVTRREAVKYLPTR
jgi:3-methyladenine DNA glycosylase AlkD